MAVGTFTTQKQSQREHESAAMSVSQTCQKLAKVPVAFVFVGVSCFSIKLCATKTWRSFNNNLS